MSEEKFIEVEVKVAQAIVKIIDLGSESGAYKGADISIVGQIRQALVEELQGMVQETSADHATQSYENISEKFTDERIQRNMQMIPDADGAPIPSATGKGQSRFFGKDTVSSPDDPYID